MASKIAKEVSAIQRGTGEKVGNLTMFVTSFFFGFAFAFYYGWLLTLVLIGGIPFLILAGAGMAISMESGFAA
jgi:ABC-type multidrug transport system fused ATPase/permease subunit